MAPTILTILDDQGHGEGYTTEVAMLKARLHILQNSPSWAVKTILAFPFCLLATVAYP